MSSPPLPLLHSGAAVMFPFLCVLSGKLPYYQSVDWDFVPVHGLCLRQNCAVPITVPPPGTAGGYTLIERHWRCVQTISSVAKLPRVAARTPLTSGWTCGTSCCMTRLLAKLCVWRFMWAPLMQTRFSSTACPGSWIFSPSCRNVPAPGVMLFSVIAAFLLLVGPSVADNVVPAGSCVFASGLVRRPLFALALPPVSRVAGRCALPFRTARGAEAEARWGRVWSPIRFFCSF
jgi:hypothetical protein